MDLIISLAVIFFVVVLLQGKIKRLQRELDKEIAWTGEKIKELESKNQLVSDHNTGEVLFEDKAVAIKGEIEYIHRSYSGRYPRTMLKTFYFKKGTEPECDLIRITEGGKKTYLRNNVEVGKDGRPTVCAKKSK